MNNLTKKMQKCRIKSLHDNNMNYRNGWGVILINLSNDTAIINQGDRIAQAVLNKVEHINWVEVDSLDDTDRGLNGFGSSGK